MRALRHESRLNQRDKDGFTQREHLEGLAARGVPSAAAMLEGPPVPDEFAYLRTWVYELHGRSGLGMGGFAPLSYATIDAWARLTDRTVTPAEVEALIQLDTALLAPGGADADESDAPAAPDQWGSDGRS